MTSLDSKTREQSIAEFIESTKHIQQEHPDVDFKTAVIEPTMNLTYDIRENLDDDKRKKHEDLITLMLQTTADPVKAEGYLWQARECLAMYPKILKQFDDIYINKRPVGVMIKELHECLSLKEGKVQGDFNVTYQWRQHDGSRSQHLNFLLSTSAMSSNGFTDMDLLEGLLTDDFMYTGDPIQPANQSLDFLNHSLLPQPLPVVGNAPDIPRPNPPAKVGGRFTRESVRVLKNWLSTHQQHPYPRESERRMLQEQTGLTKTQISNWLANARRRGKISSASSPHHSETRAVDIPPRPGTPAVRNTSDMDPLQRWVDSPPEDEPAAVTAIARAVASSARPLSGARGSSRRRRRAYKGEERRSLATPRKAFQCTFCTETFRAKHDWQRHENSLHLPLERWVCSPEGPRGRKADETRCVFCGHVDPDDAHIESHNYSACRNRPIQERTFNRKDHLNQHLRLVHNCKFTEWPMRQWKAPSPAIRSRCGFCDLVLDTWIDRVHHLADHFKAGKTMADWKGEWGFEPHILELVENSIPPYFIETERNSPFPFEGSRALVETPQTAYELLKLELAYYMQNHFYKNARMPSEAEMQLEACRIIFAAETLAPSDIICSSWLRDLVLSNQDITQQAQFGPLRSAAESRMSAIGISGKDNIFDGCPFEAQLLEFVQAKQLLSLSLRDDELREECCRIVGRLEEVSATPSDFIANWLIKAIHSSSDWLSPFRHRAGVSLLDMSPANPNLNASIQDYTRLEQEMSSYLDMQRVLGMEPNDTDLRRQARIILHGSDTILNHTAADDDYWLSAFRQRHTDGFSDRGASAHLMAARSLVMKSSTMFLNDHNYWRWFTEELRRWVAAIMSPHNPASRVPSDEEIQHYARWISYNDDDPFNQTIAENRDWLEAFKREVGIE
ncbi:hypothetical protein ACJZ2D_004466 [Fusarium nematophilum]